MAVLVLDVHVEGSEGRGNAVSLAAARVFFGFKKIRPLLISDIPNSVLVLGFAASYCLHPVCFLFDEDSW